MKEDFRGRSPFGIASPCLNCPERHTLCHATCEKYKQYKEKLAEAQKEYRTRKRKENDYLEARYGRRWRNHNEKNKY